MRAYDFDFFENESIFGNQNDFYDFDNDLFCRIWQLRKLNSEQQVH